MISKIKNENTDSLFKAVLSLKTIDECYAFFDDLCTVPEIKAMAQRYAVARMLDDGEIYTEIVAHTGASTATISSTITIICVENLALFFVLTASLSSFKPIV